jgi:DNA-binding response OmpR family regulator
MMPKLDGFDLREKILLERQKLKVLVMSGALDPEIVGEDFPIIRKPFRPDELISEVDRVLNQSSHRSVA